MFIMPNEMQNSAHFETSLSSRRLTVSLGVTEPSDGEQKRINAKQKKKFKSKTAEKANKLVFTFLLSILYNNMTKNLQMLKKILKNWNSRLFLRQYCTIMVLQFYRQKFHFLAYNEPIGKKICVV